MVEHQLLSVLYSLRIIDSDTYWRFCNNIWEKVHAISYEKLQEIIKDKDFENQAFTSARVAYKQTT